MSNAWPFFSQHKSLSVFGVVVTIAVILVSLSFGSYYLGYITGKHGRAEVVNRLRLQVIALQEVLRCVSVVAEVKEKDRDASTVVTFEDITACFPKVGKESPESSVAPLKIPSGP